MAYAKESEILFYPSSTQQPKIDTSALNDPFDSGEGVPNNDHSEHTPASTLQGGGSKNHRKLKQVGNHSLRATTTNSTTRE